MEPSHATYTTMPRGGAAQRRSERGGGTCIYGGARQPPPCVRLWHACVVAWLQWWAATVRGPNNWGQPILYPPSGPGSGLLAIRLVDPRWEECSRTT